MDRKSGTQTNNGIKYHDELAKLLPKTTINDANTTSKQIPAKPNTAEPKQRVIKQIVSLDAKKLKALGIESNILSALTKFNGKDKGSTAKTKPMTAGTVTNTKPSTSVIETPQLARKPIINATIPSSSPSVKPIIALTGNAGLTHKKSDETSPAKKIQVLSNVLLNENKLDLNIFPAIASSSSSIPNVSSKRISYVSPVPRPSQIKRIETDKVLSSVVSAPIVVHLQHQKTGQKSNVAENRADNRTQSELIIRSSPEKSSSITTVQEISVVKSPIKSSSTVKTPVESHSPVKKTTKSPVKQPDSDRLSSQINEADSLKGFSLTELKSSQNQFENLQHVHQVHSNPSTAAAVEQNKDKPENEKEIQKIHSMNEVEGSAIELSNTFTTSDTISSDQSSDSESDLDELILEAQLVIENERQSVDTDDSEDSPEPKILPKKPRIVQKKFLDMLTEHVDKDRLIDDFLVSTSNSFHTNDISDSDTSEDDHDDFNLDDGDSDSIAQLDDTEKDSEEPEKSTLEVEVQPTAEDISTIEAIDQDASIAEVTVGDLSKAEPVDENSQAEVGLTKCEEIEAIEEASTSSPGRKKRKISAKSEISSKRKKSKSISDDKIASITVQTQEITTNTVAEPNVVEARPRVIQEASEVQSSIPVIKQEQQEPTVTDDKPATAKRGRKPKQSILNDYFSVQNSIRNATKQSLDEVINSLSTKRSRSGRIIKPKTFDIETESKVKPARKTRKELTNERDPEQEVIIVRPETGIEVKTESIAPKPLKKRRDKKGEYIIPDDIPSNDTFDDNTNESIDEGIASRATEAKPSIISSTPITEQPTARRKSTKPLKSQPIDTITESPSQDNISLDINTATLATKRKGRPPKKSLMLDQTINQISAINSIENEAVTIKQEYIETPTKVIPTKRKGRARKTIAVIDDENASSSEDMPISSLNDHLKTPREEVYRQQRRTSKIFIADEIETTPSISESIATPTPTSSASPSVTPTVESSKNVDDSQNLEPTVKKRGRPRLTPKAVVAECDSPIRFKCGACQSEIPKNKWKAHEATHNGVTFRVGLDEPIDVEDSSTMNRLMIRYMKANKIQYFKCPKCGEKKKSALGYISHVELCGLTEEEIASLKAECEYCKKLYRKVSLLSHQQGFCPVRRLEMAQQQADQMVESAVQEEQNIEVIYSESGRPKRMIKNVKPTSKPIDDFIKIGLKITGGTYKSWSNQLREENIIKCTNDNCTFSVTDLQEMRQHFMKCRESIVQCKICLKTERSRNAIVEHIETTHPDDLKLSEYEDDNDEDDDFRAGNSSSDSSYGESGDDENEPRRNKSFHRNRRVPLKRIMEEDSPTYWEMLSAFYTRILNSRPGFHRKSYQWTKEFVEQNYDLNALALAAHMRSTFEIVSLPQREVNKFLGILHFKSPKFRCQKQTEYQLVKSEVATNENWSNLNLFESAKSTHINTEPSTIFCGGKIITADWIPFPSEYKGPQILAICAQGQGKHSINATNGTPMEKCRSLMQLWSVTTNDTDNTKIDKTEFMYGIAYEDGPICSTSFCPSDAFVASKRLAIVALPDTIGNINIISIPDNVSRAKTKTPTVIKLKPEFRLQLGWTKDENPPQTITQMVWSRTKGHKVLCASYNSGLIAVWNFDHLNSSYLMQKGSVDGIPILLPRLSFMGSLSFITQLDLHCDEIGNARWLLVGALDRRMRMYDLQDPQLIPFTSTVFKSRIISGVWPLHWPIYLTIIDAVLTRQNGGLHIKPILYTNNQSSNATLYNDCEPSNLAFSDWLNTGVFGNEAGDLFMINFQQLLVYDRYDESSEQKVLSCTDVFVDESSSTDLNDRISILFKDFEEKVLSPKLNTRGPAVDLSPSARINRVTINPNESHQKLYAVGYELGFCRIHFIPETIE